MWNWGVKFVHDLGSLFSIGEDTLLVSNCCLLWLIQVQQLENIWNIHSIRSNPDSYLRLWCCFVCFKKEQLHLRGRISGRIHVAVQVLLLLCDHQGTSSCVLSYSHSRVCDGHSKKKELKLKLESVVTCEEIAQGKVGEDQGQVDWDPCFRRLFNLSGRLHWYSGCDSLAVWALVPLEMYKGLVRTELGMP